MVGLDLDKYRKGGQLILGKKDIEFITEQIIADFNPRALKEPIALSADEFIEQYLGYSLRYEYLTNNQSILGLVTFSGGKITVFNPETEGIQDVFLSENTVIIDSSLLEETKQGRYEFTGFHEGGHCVLHVPSQADSDQLRFTELPSAGTIICRKDENPKPCRIGKTKEEWLEWQADYFSACMKMPRYRVKEVAIETLRSVGIKKDCVSCYDKDEYEECSEYLPRVISEVFVTSKSAAKYRLEELRILKRDYDMMDLLDEKTEKAVGYDK